jgi:benzodiazapine receptor
LTIFFRNITAFFIVLAVNTLAFILPLNGQTTDEIANKLPVLLMPASYVFSIWGLIYFLLGIWVCSQLLPSRRNLLIYKNTSNLFVLSCVLNCIWICVWHYEYFLLSVLVIIALLITLIALYKKTNELKTSKFDILPFSIYLGWISVATMINAIYFLEFIGWSGWGASDIAWALILLFFASGIAVQFLRSQHDHLYPLVFTWAFIGIGIKNNEIEPFVSYIAFGLAICLVFTLFLPVKRRS